MEGGEEERNMRMAYHGFKSMLETLIAPCLDISTDKSTNPFRPNPSISTRASVGLHLLLIVRAPHPSRWDCRDSNEQR